MSFLKNKKGLTLIELLAVLVILALIAAVAVPTVNTLLSNTRKNADLASLNNYVEAARLHSLNSSEAITTVLASELEISENLYFFRNADQSGNGVSSVMVRFVVSNGVVSDIELVGGAASAFGTSL